MLVPPSNRNNIVIRSYFNPVSFYRVLKSRKSLTVEEYIISYLMDESPPGKPFAQGIQWDAEEETIRFSHWYEQHAPKESTPPEAETTDSII